VANTEQEQRGVDTCMLTVDSGRRASEFHAIDIFNVVKHFID